MDDSGSGSHVHVSLWQNGKNVFMADDESSKHGMSTIGEEFMAGVLHHIPSLLAFTAPIPNRLGTPPLHNPYNVKKLVVIYKYTHFSKRTKIG